MQEPESHVNNEVHHSREWNQSQYQELRDLLSLEFVELKLPSGCKHGKVDQQSAPVYYNYNIYGQRPKSSSKALFKLDFFSWWLSLLCWILEYRKPSRDLKYLSLKVMLISKWSGLVLDVDFMTSIILKFNFFFIPWTYFRASSKLCGKPQT